MEAAVCASPEYPTGSPGARATDTTGGPRATRRLGLGPFEAPRLRELLLLFPQQGGARGPLIGEGTKEHRPRPACWGVDQGQTSGEDQRNNLANFILGPLAWTFQ